MCREFGCVIRRRCRTVFVCGDGDIHLLHQVDQVTQHLQYVDSLGPQPGLGRHQPLAERRHTFAQALDPLVHVATDGRVQLLPDHKVQIPAGEKRGQTTIFVI